MCSASLDVKRKTWHTDLEERWEHWRKGAEIDPSVKQGILKTQQKATLQHQTKRNVDAADHNTVFFSPHWDTLSQMKNSSWSISQGARGKQRCETWIKVVKKSPKTALNLAKLWLFRKRGVLLPKQKHRLILISNHYRTQSWPLY